MTEWPQEDVFVSSRFRCLAILFFLLGCSALLAQNGRIVGTVRDQSGAVVPNVPVQATHLATNAQRSVNTNNTGDYVLTALPVGAYRVTAEAQGFKKFSAGPLQLTVDQTIRVDIELHTGQVTDTVTVTSSVPVVNSETSSVSQLIEETQIKQLPLNGRHFMQLGLLVPGTADGRDSNVTSRQGGASISVNGQSPDQNNWMLDGVDNNATMFGLAVIIPSTEAIQEFRFETSNYSAEYGRAAGGVVNVQIKSGSNNFHGSLFEFLRNDNFDSRQYFDAGVDPLAYNQFGGALGGRVVRDRTFFFFNYEGQRIRQSSTTGGIVPTAAMRTGDFSGMATIYDPLTLANGVRQPFANNRIPTERFHSASTKITPYFPLPNSTDAARNYVRQASSMNDGDQWHARVDQKLTEKQWIFGRLSMQNRDIFAASVLPTNGDVQDNQNYAWTAQHTYTLRSNLINEFRAGGNHYDFGYVHETMGEPLTKQFGLPNVGAGTRLDGMPDIRVTNMPSLGGTAAVPLDRVETTTQFSDALTMIHGNHTLKVGGEFQTYTSMNDQVQFARGRYSFTGSFTAQNGKTYTNGFADFLLGYPKTYTVLVDLKSAEANEPEYMRQHLYIQDDWKVTSRLTLNAGLRWEHHGGWKEANNRWGAFDTGTGQIVYAKDYPMNYTLKWPYRMAADNVMEGRMSGFAPRFGFAFRPLNTNRLVLRGAYGVFWSQLTSQDLVNTSLAVPPGQVRDSRTSGATTPEFKFGELSVTLGSTSDSLVAATPTISQIVAYGFRGNPYIQQWNFGIETELFPNWGLSASYVGSKGTHLRTSYQANPAMPPAAGSIQARRRYQAFGAISMFDSDGFSTYEALQVKVERRYRSGLSLLGAYTWSKSIDDVDGYQDPDNRAAAKGLSTNDLRHRASVAAVYELPFGRGKQLLSSTARWVDYLVREWQTNAIVTMRSGLTLSAVTSGDTANAGAGTVYPNVTGNSNGNLPSGDRTIDRWFDTSAFTAPAAYTFGNAGRNILSGPGSATVDFGVSRSFLIREGHRLQFRGEFFNLFNRSNWGTPNATVGSSAFGTIRSTGGARQVQLALRYQF